MCNPASERLDPHVASIASIILLAIKALPLEVGVYPSKLKNPPNTKSVKPKEGCSPPLHLQVLQVPLLPI